MGLYRELGPAITILLTLLLFRAQVALSAWWLERRRFGPAEWLWRSLTYGKIQPWKPEPGLSVRLTASQSAIPKKRSALFNAVASMTRRLVFIVAVGFAIVYFCTLGLQLGVNSTTGGAHLTLWDSVGPVFDRTIDFFVDAFHGDLGHVGRGLTDRTWVSTTELLTSRYLQSMRLLAISIVLATAVGIVAGGAAAVWRHSSLALPTLTLTVIGISVPSFLLALLLQIAAIAFYRRTGVRMVLFGPGLHDLPSLLPLVTFPALVLAARPTAHITRVTFVTISDILTREFVRTARAKGVDPRLVLLRHTLPNAAVSILTAVVVSLRFALGSLPVAEVFFDWRGLGVTMLNGIFQRNLNVVAGAALSLGVTFMLINLTLELLYRVIDPRLRAQDNGGNA
jgi:peptide/nickel transport system permease protein